jgi:hypothetical protein
LKRAPKTIRFVFLCLQPRKERELLFWVKATEFKRGKAESANWFHHHT